MPGHNIVISPLMQILKEKRKTLGLTIRMMLVMMKEIEVVLRAHQKGM
jgi:hypothetical protein